MIRIVTAASLAALLAAQPAFAQDGSVAASSPATAAPAPAKHMSFAEKLAIAAGVVGAGVVAVKALKGSKSGDNAGATQQPAGQPTAQ